MWHYRVMNTKQRGTLKAVFSQPTPAGLAWVDVESLLRALGAEITRGRDSRVRVALGSRRAVFHMPHPRPACLPGLVRAVRDFLHEAGVDEP